MDKLSQILPFVYDIHAPLLLRMPLTKLMEGDSGANTLQLTLMDGDNAASLSGYTAVGEVRREDGVNVTFACTISGNVITGTLNADCYAYPGEVTVRIQLAKTDGFRRTVLMIGSEVGDRGHGPVIDGGNVVEDVAGVIAMMDEMRENNAASIAAAETATTAAANADAAREAIQGDLSSLKDTKADAITDTSARAASHDLYAQRGPMGVTLYGATTETGEGDKSPDNPYEISGVDVARVHAGGKNLLPFPYASDTLTQNGVTWTVNANGGITASGTPTGFSAIEVVGLNQRINWCGNISFALLGTFNNVVFDVTLYRADFTRIAQTEGFTSKVINMDAYPECVAVVVNVKRLLNDVAMSETVYPMIVAGDEIPTTYEPYTATTADLPLLPDGAALMGNGTVDDTVENDVPSGCNVCVTFDGSEDEGWVVADNPPRNRYRASLPIACENASSGAIAHAFASHYVCTSADSTYQGTNGFSLHGLNISVRDDKITSLEDWLAQLAANPLTVYYRSTEYTPEKDLRVCRVVRRMATAALDGTEYMTGGVVSGVPYYKAYLTKKGIDAKDKCYCTHYNAKFSIGEGNAYMTGGSMNELLIYPQVEITTVDEFKAYLAEQYAAGTPVTFTYPLATPEVYMTDPYTLRKPDTLTTDTVTVTGGGETSVEYPHDTKHYIDSQIAAAVALTLNG